MPNIFDEKTRERIRMKLFENGFAFFKKFGLSKTSIEDIAKSAGIAKGTFYRFFESKDHYVLELVKHERGKMKQKFEHLIKEKGYLDEEGVRRFLEQLVYGDYNVFAYLTGEEMAALTTRNNIELIPHEQLVESTTTMILSHIPNKRPDCNWKVVANCIRVIAMTWMNREQLVEEAIEETMDGLISLTLEQIFGKGEQR